MNTFNGTDLFSFEDLGEDLSVLYNGSNSSFFDLVKISPSLELFRNAITWMEHVVLPVIIIVGVLGNSVSFLVFMCSHLRRLSSSVYLAALSLADAGFLMCTLIKWANDLGVPLLYNDQWCQLFLYVSCVFTFLSVWYVVSFSAERFIAVCLPFQRQDMCTPRRAKVVVAALGTLASLSYTFVIWTSEMKIPFSSKTTMCLPKKEYYSLWTWFYSIDTVFTLIIPSIAIIFLNIRIIVAVVRLHRDARKMNENGPYKHVRGLPQRRSSSRRSTCCRTSRREQPNRTTPHTSQVKVTKMLVTVSTTFLVLNLPTHCLRLYTFIQFMSVDAKYYPHSQLFRLLQRLFMLVHYSNFAVNFIIYNICGRNFRLGLKHLMKRIRHNIRKCWQGQYTPTTTNTTTQAGDRLHRMYTEPPNVTARAEIQSNGMHFRLQRVHSRSTSSSSKPLVSRGRRRQIKLKCRWENGNS